MKASVMCLLVCVFLLPDISQARDTFNYWPNNVERQVLNDLCPANVQQWLRDQDELSCRLFFSRVVDAKIPLEALSQTYQDLSNEQLRSIRQKATGYVRQLSPQVIKRQTAEERCMDVRESYVMRGFEFAETFKRGKAEEPGTHSIEVPVDRGWEFVVIVSTDSLNSMGVPIKLRVADEYDPNKIIVRDERAMATSIAVVQWTSETNGVAECIIELLKSSVFERGLKCDWSMALGRRNKNSAKLAVPESR